jgi:broad specificity phosphatase PhoE
MVRHGETDHNVARRIQGPLLDDPLNARGLSQAKALEGRFAGERARGLDLAAVYASPLKRAWETAEAVARGARVPADRLHAAPWLIEFSWGVYLGKTEEGETLEAMKAMHHHWTSGRVDMPVEGGESPRVAWARASAGLFAALEAHAPRPIATVAHGRINKILLAGLLHGDLARMDDFGQGNTSVTLLEHADGAPWSEGWRARYVNDKSHLASVGEGTQSAEGGGPLV